MLYFPTYTHVELKIHSFYYYNWISFITCLKNLLKEFNHHSWNSENISSLIFSKSSGNLEHGSGQDQINSACTYDARFQFCIVHLTLPSKKSLKIVGTQHNLIWCSACIGEANSHWFLVTVIVKEDQINTLVCSPGAFIWQCITGC